MRVCVVYAKLPGVMSHFPLILGRFLTGPALVTSLRANGILLLMDLLCGILGDEKK